MNAPETRVRSAAATSQSNSKPGARQQPRRLIAVWSVRNGEDNPGLSWKAHAERDCGHRPCHSGRCALILGPIE